MDCRIVIRERDHLASRTPDACVTGNAQPGLRLRHVDDVSEALDDGPCGRLRRVVVDDNHLVRPLSLRAHRAQAAFERGRALTTADHHRDCSSLDLVVGVRDRVESGEGIRERDERGGIGRGRTRRAEAGGHGCKGVWEETLADRPGDGVGDELCKSRAAGELLPRENSMTERRVAPPEDRKQIAPLRRLDQGVEAVGEVDMDDGEWGELTYGTVLRIPATRRTERWYAVRPTIPPTSSASTRLGGSTLLPRTLLRSSRSCSATHHW